MNCFFFHTFNSSQLIIIIIKNEFQKLLNLTNIYCKNFIYNACIKQLKKITVKKKIILTLIMPT